MTSLILTFDLVYTQPMIACYKQKSSDESRLVANDNQTKWRALKLVKGKLGKDKSYASLRHPNVFLKYTATHTYFKIYTFHSQNLLFYIVTTSLLNILLQIQPFMSKLNILILIVTLSVNNFKPVFFVYFQLLLTINWQRLVH